MRTELWTASSLGLLVLLSGATPSAGSEAIAEREEAACGLCHVDPETDQLTDQGRYFQYMRSLDGFGVVVERFGPCTYCHVQEAGSLELTREGYRFRWMMEDMEGLRAWLEENHPHPTEEETPEEPDRENPQGTAGGDSTR